MPPRQSADERREHILRVAVAEFAQRGLEGTSTEVIAERAGISQPYVFRLFGSKKELFKAAVGRCFDRVRAVFEAAAQKAGDVPAAERLHEMGHAYVNLLTEREQLLLQMQAYAACADPEVCRLVRDRWLELNKIVGKLSGAQPEEVTRFLATGMLLNVSACMQLPLPSKAQAHDWAHQVLGIR